MHSEEFQMDPLVESEEETTDTTHLQLDEVDMEEEGESALLVTDEELGEEYQFQG